MNKQEFLNALRTRFSKLSQTEVEDRIGFYSEMIDDRVEEGLSEEDAVRAIGTDDELAAEILSDPPHKKVKKTSSERRLKTWAIVLLAVGSPLWIVLLITAFSAVAALTSALWALVASAWASFGALCGCALGGVAGAVMLFASGSNIPSGILLIAISLASSGLAIFAFFGARAATVGSARLMRVVARGITRLFRGKEEA